MTIEELALGDAGGIRLSFHEHLTVVSGIAEEERTELVDTLRQAAVGGMPGARLRFVDHVGRRVDVLPGADEPHLQVVGPGDAPQGAGALVAPRVTVVDAAALGLVPEPPKDESDDLRQARLALAVVDAELAQVQVGLEAVARRQRDLDAVADERRKVLADAPRRAYARARLGLRAAQAEANALGGGPETQARQRRVLEIAPALREETTRWRSAAGQLARLDDGDLGETPLDPEELAAALAAPDVVPPALPGLLASYETAAAARERLVRRLAQLREANAPSESDPVVLALAHQDQAVLWATHRRVLSARRDMEDRQLAAGGLGASHAAADIVAEIEHAHTSLGAARERAKRQLMIGAAIAGIAATGSIARLGAIPLVAGLGLVMALGLIAVALTMPQRSVRAAEGAEATALAKVSASSYLGFQLRRVEIMDPSVRRGLTRTASDHSIAMAAWADLAGPIDPARASQLQEKVQACAAELQAGREGAAEMVATAHALEHNAEPAAAEAADAVLAACGVDAGEDIAPAEAVARLHRLVALGAQASRQRAHDQARRQHARRASELATILDQLEVASGSLLERARHGAELVVEAEAAERARRAARPLEEVLADLRRCEEAEQLARCPGWETVTIDEAEEPDPAVLDDAEHQARRHLGEARAALGDPDALVQRRAAIEHRIEALVPPPAPVEVDLDDVLARLLARLAEARGTSGAVEASMGVLDDAFAYVPVGATWDLLDLLGRLAPQVQLLYLTDSPYVTAWARQYADRGVALVDISQGT